MNADEIISGLAEQGYYADKQIAYGVLSAIQQKSTPLLVEGAPGVGKTSLAVATADMLGIPLIRVSCYEGVSADSILYDYDYQKQLLITTALREKLNEHLKDASVKDSVDILAKNINVYGTDFLLQRPVLKSLIMTGRKVLLIDELDKADEGLEHSLLEVLSDYAMTIPEYGTIQCAEDSRPIVFITSNNYRELSEPLKRRCFYLYIRPKTHDEILNIVRGKIEANDEFISKVADALTALQDDAQLKHPIAISEGLEWAKLLRDVFQCESGDDIRKALPYTVGALAKNSSDVDRVIRDISHVV